MATCNSNRLRACAPQSFLLVLLATVGAIGCGPKYHVYRESHRVSLRGAHSFLIAPIRFVVRTNNEEQEPFDAWLARHHPRHYAEFEEAYLAMAEQAAARLAERTGYSVSALASTVSPGDFVVTVRIVRAQIQETASTFQGQIDAEATVYTANGQEVAVIGYSTSPYVVGAMFDDADVSPWIRELAIDAGNRLALFLPTRTNPTP